MQRLGFLDALRGFAIAGVVAVHGAQVVPDLPPLLTSACAFGARGVQLFYMVSAYTLLTVYSDGLEPRTFFVRRFFRIAPAFYLAILLFLAVQGTDPRPYAPGGIGLRHIVMTATFLHGWIVKRHRTGTPFEARSASNKDPLIC